MTPSPLSTSGIHELDRGTERALVLFLFYHRRIVGWAFFGSRSL
jgi:hypothetical protein